MRQATYRLRKGGREIIVNQSDYHADLAGYEGWRRVGEARGENDAPPAREPGQLPPRDRVLEEMTKAELLAYAAGKLDLRLDPLSKKADMVAAIRESEEKVA